MIRTERNNNPSVIAKLMGLHEVPLKQQPVSGPKRVLSENYLQKSASVGSRGRRWSKVKQKNREILKKPNSTLNDSSKVVSLRYLENRSTTFGWEFKKQLLERSKRPKVCQEIWSGIRVCDHSEVPSMAGLESKQRLELGTQDWKDKSATKLVYKRFNISSLPNKKLKKVSKHDLGFTSGRQHNNVLTNSEDVEFSFGDEGIKQIDEKAECNDSAKEGCFPCSLDVSFEQDSPCEDRFTSLNCIDIDNEHGSNTTEAHHPSPNSVLEPDNLSIDEYGDKFSTDLHGLYLKLQILKSESEENQSKPEILTSSDEDAAETKRCFGPKESQEFSYLVNVLDEIESFERWHSVEHIVSPLIFETLEKKYGKQESWNKADRRLLFDRIKLGLSEILRQHVEFIVYSKLLKRKMSSILRRDAIEEELWKMVVSEGKEVSVNADLSEKAVGKEPWLEELGEEVDSIVVEIEAFLFNELALELVAF
ncbi:hypothetical protein Lser_V15G36300 [Lactuca serriola]